jgi:hypothetical protein
MVAALAVSKNMAQTVTQIDKKGDRMKYQLNWKDLQEEKFTKLALWIDCIGLVVIMVSIISLIWLLKG